MNRFDLDRRLRSKNGMSLAMVLVASAIFGMLVVAVTRFLENTAKSQAGISIRGEAQDYVNMLKTALAKGPTCQAILDLTAADFVFTPPTPTAPQKVILNLPKLVYAGQNLVPARVTPPGSPILGRDLVLRDAFIEVGQNVAGSVSSSNDYQAELKIALDVTKASRVTGAASHVISIPMLITAQRVNPTDPLDLTVRAQTCASAALDLPYNEICQNMGGRWLDGTRSYMPKPKCNMQNDIALDVVEWPDGVTVDHPAQIPDDGCTNSEGERVSECRYNASGVIKTYNCTSRCGNRSGDRCAYDTSTRKWGVFYFTSGGAMSTKRRDCDRGVTVSTRSSGYSRIDWDEDLAKAYNPTALSPFTLPQRTDHLESANRCQYVWDADLWQNCNNQTNPKGAVEGVIGSCIWVDHVKLTGSNTAARITSYCVGQGGTCPSGMNIADYTGWIRVTAARTPVLAATPKLSYIREARGTPCFVVEVNSSVGEDQPWGTSPSTAAPNADEITDTSLIKQCYTHDEHDPSTQEPSGTYNRNSVYQCTNDTDIDSLDDLGKGNCWYVSGVKLKKDDYGTNNGRSPTTFTGWVYYTGPQPTTAAWSMNGSKVISTSATTIFDFAVPCRDGVRRAAP